MAAAIAAAAVNAAAAAVAAAVAAGGRQSHWAGGRDKKSHVLSVSTVFKPFRANLNFWKDFDGTCFEFSRE